jgi:transcriptional regulator with PAS, ATPase and Fis domain
MEDIAMLVNTFIDRLNRLRGLSVTGISPKALSLLMAHSYPGNIRELENIVEHALVLCPKGQIDVRCLPEYLTELTPNHAQTARIDEALKTTEARVISGALNRNHYNRLAAARELGVHKSTLFRKIKRLNIHLPETDGRSGRKPSK